ncbi:hypothetical protein [Phenylobacterium soli]|uniref:hypothetical protein n=2 Tax=Phenylobacterium soli TaxID=2170551 RepID=UPI0014028CE2|nr:hypothetical protein [Phenylobacterium soli]
MRGAAGRAISRVMYKTYELYPEGEDRGFEPVTCRSHEELMAAVERLMADRGANAVEVRHFGAHLFTVTA